MRTFTQYCDRDLAAKHLVEALPTIQGDVARYRQQMRLIGRHLATAMLPSIQKKSFSDIGVICTVEDADFLARGVIDQLEADGFGKQIRLLCLWNEKIKDGNIAISPIVRQYKEEFDPKNTLIIVVKSIISGACVVKTNITRAISFANPQSIFIASPVMLSGAESRLCREFPAEIAAKFEFIHFATDTEKEDENVMPGIGGSVYELLGLGNSQEKNRYVPNGTDLSYNYMN